MKKWQEQSYSPAQWGWEGAGEELHTFFSLPNLCLIWLSRCFII